MTELENLIRSALHERAAEVTPDQLRGEHDRRTPGSTARRRSPAVLAAAAVVLLAVALSVWTAHGRRSTDSGASPATGISGYQWNLTSVTDTAGTYHYVQGGPDATFLVFRPDGEIEGNDGVNYFSGVTDTSGTGENGRYHLTSRGYEITGEVGRTLANRGGADSAAVASHAAIDAALATGHDFPATVHTNTLTITASHYTLTLQRGVAVGIEPLPSPTPSLSNHGLASADYNRPGTAHGCGPSIGTITIDPDGAHPSCAKLNPGQRLRIINNTNGFGQTGHTITLLFRGLPTLKLSPGQAAAYPQPISDYLAPGQHLGGFADLWVMP